MRGRLLIGGALAVGAAFLIVGAYIHQPEVELERAVPELRAGPRIRAAGPGFAQPGPSPEENSREDSASTAPVVPEQLTAPELAGNSQGGDLEQTAGSANVEANVEATQEQVAPPVSVEFPPPAPAQVTRPAAVAPAPASAPVQAVRAPAAPPALAPAQQAPPPPAPRPQAASASVSLYAFELDMYSSHNAFRAQGGLGGLQLDPALVMVARQRAADMAQNGYFSHYSPANPNRAQVYSFLAAAGYGYNKAGENIARNNYADSQSVSVAMNAFMASPGHHANIMSTNYRWVGVGFATAPNGMKYYAVVFAY